MNRSDTVEIMYKWSTLVAAIAIMTNLLVMAEGGVICSRYGFDKDHPGLSCADIYYKNSESHGKSGYYFINSTDDHVYCDMELECAGTKGGWMRIADVDTRRGDECPSGWVKSSQHHSCRADKDTPGCYPTILDTLSTTYSEVCGKITGYQKGSMDRFQPSARPLFEFESGPLDGIYVDGISVTLDSPRKHLWTYVVGLSDDYNYSGVNCPCAKYPGPDPPTFVRNHYYCESGNTGRFDSETLYTNDTLWDGADCGPENGCCYQPGMPWFYRDLPKVENSNIEVRICRDQHYHDEGVTVEQMELYVH